MEALLQFLVDSLSFNSVAPHSAGNVTNYMGQTMTAMNNLATLGSFIHQVVMIISSYKYNIHKSNLTNAQSNKGFV